MRKLSLTLVYLLSISVLISSCKKSDDDTTPTTITGITDADCPNDNSTSTTNTGCSTNPTITSQYNESVAGNVRTIVSNTYPNHKYSTTSTLTPIDRTLTVDATPAIATSTTSVLNEGRPARYFGVALNGVLIAPAPAEPFIFTNTQTGEFNWDWVFEPTTNQGSGRDMVALDCASAHQGPQGYHYHGNMFEYAELLLPGVSGSTVPTQVVQVGWASDGFPIIYRYGPDASGNLKLLTPSYRVKEGLRPGDGVSEPCGSYNGKYTNDYEYVEGLGDLDACNGIARNITLTTVDGTKTFSYFYVITDSFPQIGRCLSGTPSKDFENR
ncbi:hypothetical protein BKI52_01670 [marine bacterium AO1-C]|nr:hypothetical protein BKI52_01670 [marine bacterium AO1-C]